MILGIGTIVSGRYEIKEKLGSGGMAIVYKALDLKLDRDVTFKVMREEYSKDEEFIKRFYIEARAAARLSHQNIVNVYDVGQEGDVYYIVMEYIEGHTLKDIIAHRGRFDNNEILGVAIQIASALEHSHNNNIIHRDIKPQNILMTAGGTVKVTDFGIARASSTSTVTNSSNTMGSVHYFSPEQARGRFVDARSDIYSLGIVMYEMATGVLPFDDDTPVAVALKHLNDPLPPIKDYNPEISESLEKIILKAAEKISSNRYESAELMGNDLKRALTNASGDFVRTANDNISNQTVTLSEEEMSQIRNGKRSNDNSEKDMLDEFYDEEDDLQEEEVDKRTERRVVIAAVITAFALICIISSIAYYMYVKNKPVPVAVPDLYGENFEEARLRVQDELGLFLKIGLEEYNNEQPKNTIINQDYEPDAEVFAGTTIEVSVSLGTQKASVPSVVGLSLEEAYELLTARQFQVKEEHEFDDRVPINTIISQEPRENVETELGTVVVLKVSKGEEIAMTVVPYLTDYTETQARIELEEKNLKVGFVTTSSSDTIEEGRVISQLIPGGREVTEGTSIGLVISTGKPQTIEPEDTVESGEPGETGEGEEGTGGNGETGPDRPLETPSPAAVTKMLTLSPSFPAGTERVSITINKKTAESTSEVYSKEHSVSDFPLQIEVSGTGIVEYQMLIDGEYVGSENVYFEE